MVTYPSFSKYTHLISYHYKTGHIIDGFTYLTYLLVFFFIVLCVSAFRFNTVLHILTVIQGYYRKVSKLHATLVSNNLVLYYMGCACKSVRV